MTHHKRLLALVPFVASLAACGVGDDPDSGEDPRRPHHRSVPLTIDTAFADEPTELSTCPAESVEELVGTAGIDNLVAKAADWCVSGAGEGDSIVVKPGADRSVVLAGDGDDWVVVRPDAYFTIATLGDGSDTFMSQGGASAVWGGPEEDTLLGSAGPDVLDGGSDDDVLNGRDGDDRVVGQRGDDELQGGGGDDLIRGGVGSDYIDGGPGDDVAYGDEGIDHMIGGQGADVLEGGIGDDDLDGGPGRDRLLGGFGDDELHGGDQRDLLIPGAGIDDAHGGDGDDLVVILDACQVGDGEELDGGGGNDTLLTPLSVPELIDLGVNLSNFEIIRQFPAGGFECDTTTCDCGNYESTPIGGELCDYSAEEYGLSEQERMKVEWACESFIEELPLRLDELAAIPTTNEAESIVSEWGDRFAAVRMAQFGGPATPHVPNFDPTVPMPNVVTSDEPCDMPQRDLHIGVGRGGIDNCTDGEEDAINEALDHSRFMLFRMRQQIDAVVDAQEDPVVAEELWTRGDDDDWGRFALSNWFGVYDANQARFVQSTVGELEEIFYADDDTLLGPKHNVQCYHRPQWWQYVVLAALSPQTLLLRTITNPCFYEGDEDAIAHAMFAAPVAGRVAAAYALYPFESVELCRDAFESPHWEAPERLGGIIMHELLHFHDNDAGGLRDRHGDVGRAICDGPCYHEPDAEELATIRPDLAVVNIDNYRAWSNATSTLYTRGYCDDTSPGLCFESSCCGDGELQTELSETCDGSDFGPLSCLSEAGLTEGTLNCSTDCQSIDVEACFGSCGNGAIDPALNEDCDQTDFGGASCASLFGSDMGSLGCSEVCTRDTSSCDGQAPASYFDCGVEADSSCLDNPEDCHEIPGAGTCTGGPCSRTDPSHRTEGQLDPSSDFHPRGSFRDTEQNLYRCDDGPLHARTCVDEDGYGVCKECGLGEGQTMEGCACVSSDECGADLVCFGGQYPNGGFCWAPEGPPDFQCDAGACGQSFRGSDGGSYCEHYTGAGSARCMPQRCDDIGAQTCAELGLICDEEPDDPADAQECAVECEVDDDCDEGWPAGMQCTPALTCAFPS